ncbi:MAG: class D sortase [Bacilli bacterium]|nr:class D sortase [Bacilli bacterium]
MKTIKEIIKQTLIAIFFTSFTIVLFHLTCNSKVDLVLSLINKITIIEKKNIEKEIKFDQVKKRLLEYPEYGTIYATLKIKDLGLELPVYHGDTLDIIKYGVGHYSGSYFPGEGGSIVLAAHNSKEHFMRLPELKIGANISIETSYGTFNYQVTGTKIISDKDEASLPIQNNEEILMMYTCYPMTSYGYKTERYVVYSKLVGDKFE